MKRILAGIAMLMGMFIVTNVFAQFPEEHDPRKQQEFFYSKRLGSWVVMGQKGNPATRQNPVCVAATQWGADEDRSRVMIVSDLADGELYMAIGTYGWNIQDPPGKYELRLNMTNGDRTIIGHFVEYLLIDQRSVVIPLLPPEVFLPALSGSTMMEFVMPGSIAIFRVKIENAQAVVNTLIDCVDSVKKGARDI
jgi:hypothetical protein